MYSVYVIFHRSGSMRTCAGILQNTPETGASWCLPTPSGCPTSSSWTGVKPCDVRLANLKYFMCEPTLCSAEDYFKSQYKDDFRVMIQHNGHVSWTFGGHFKTACSLNIEYYPFDEQKCYIIIENWKYPKMMVRTEEMNQKYKNYLNWFQVDLHFHENSIDMFGFHENTQWRVQGTEVTSQAIGEEELQYPQIIFHFELERKVQKTPENQWSMLQTGRDVAVVVLCQPHPGAHPLHRHHHAHYLLAASLLRRATLTRHHAAARLLRVPDHNCRQHAHQLRQHAHDQ